MTELNLTLNLDFTKHAIQKPSSKGKLAKIEKKKEKKQQKLLHQLEVDNKVKELKSGLQAKKLNSQDPKKRQKASLKEARPQKHVSNDSKETSKPLKFSSIFRNNPDLPTIESKDVKPTKEDVFTSQKFSDLPLHEFLISNLEKKQGLETMTAVQQQAIPKVLSGRDVLVKSQTGSGKTLAYAVPIMQTLQGHKPPLTRLKGIHALVIVPTRELAVQSLETFHKLTQSFINIVPGALMGGENRSKEKARVRKGVTVLIATPGRLVDHLENTCSLQLDQVQHLVIDEADRLLDMGFEKDVSRIIKTLKDVVKGTLQTVLLSATLSAGVERLAGMTLKDPLHVSISDTVVTDQEVFSTPATLKHHYVLVPSKLRLVTLFAFILWKCKYSTHDRKMLVFFATQDAVEFYHQVLQALLVEEDKDYEESLNIFKLHGDMQQKDRTHVFKSFSNASSGVLFCTDVAARGLDLPQVRWIVQYNTPGKPTDYIHRVGRTARAGSVGHALMFLAPSEADYVKILHEMNIGLTSLDMMVILKALVIFIQNNPQILSTGGQRSRSVEECATAVQKKVEETVLNSKDMRTLARKAFQSFIRAYATYPANLKHIFHIKTLHLGHVAKSFGLQEPPSHIGEVISNTYVYSTKAQKELSRKRSRLATSPERRTHKNNAKKPRLDLISEYSSGLEGLNSKGAKFVKKNKTLQNRTHGKPPRNYGKPQAQGKMGKWKVA